MRTAAWWRGEAGAQPGKDRSCLRSWRALLFGEWGSKAFAPGVIRSRFVGFAHKRIESLGIDDLRLFGLSVEDGVIQWFAFVEDGEVFLGIQANGDGGMAQGIGGAFGLDLVDRFTKLDGQVFGEDTRFLPGQDLV